MQKTARVCRQSWSGPRNVRTTNDDDAIVTGEHAVIVLVIAVSEL